MNDEKFKKLNSIKSKHNGITEHGYEGWSIVRPDKYTRGPPSELLYQLTFNVIHMVSHLYLPSSCIIGLF